MCQASTSIQDWDCDRPEVGEKAGQLGGAVGKGQEEGGEVIRE